MFLFNDFTTPSLIFVTDFVCFAHLCVVTFGAFYFLLVECLVGMVLLSCKLKDEQFNWNSMLSYKTLLK